MINPIKERKAIRAIQHLLVVGRRLSFEKMPHDKFFIFFDRIEYLPSLILEKKDRTDTFEEYLESICEDFNCNEVMVWYRSIDEY
jgi:hypothetical protein